MLQRASALHCTTKQEAREISWLGLKPPIDILANPIKLTQLQLSSPLGEQWRQSNQIPLTEPLLLVAGRLHHKKGLDLLPTVLQGIAHRSWHIVFIGTDEDGTGTKLRRAFARAGLADRSHWFEHVPSDQLSGPYNAADLLLLPSRHENFGNVVIESLLCGCPVLISENVGVAEALGTCPGVTLIKRSSRLWIQALDRLLDEPRPGMLSNLWIQSHFSQASISLQAKELYSSLICND